MLLTAHERCAPPVPVRLETSAPRPRSLPYTPIYAMEAYGLIIGIRSNTPDLLEGCRTLLPPGSRPAATSRIDRLYWVLSDERETETGQTTPVYKIWRGRTLVARTPTREDAFAAFESDVQLFVAEHAHDRIFVHAGVVGWRGRAIVIPGPSFAGKSTLVAELLRTGAEYYSDEYAVFDRAGRVHPYSRPLKLRHRGEPHGRRYPAERFGSRAGRAPLPVGIVLRTQYIPSVRWRARALTCGEAMLALLDNAVPARSRSELTMRVLRHVAATPGLRAFGGEHADAAALAPVLLELLAE